MKHPIASTLTGYSFALPFGSGARPGISGAADSRRPEFNHSRETGPGIMRRFRSSSVTSVLLMVGTVLVSSLAVQAVPVPIPGLRPTGVSSGAFFANLPAFSVDPHYTLIQSLGGYGPNAFVALPRPTSWVPNQPVSQWISPDGVNTPLLSGLYVYQLQFDLTGLDPSMATITGRWTADDNSRVVLNGNFGAGVIQTTTYGQFDTFTFNSGFVPGINTLDFRVGNTFFQASTWAAHQDYT